MAVIDSTTARNQHDMVWDGRRVILFGGRHATASGPLFGETWVHEPPFTASFSHTFGLGE